MIKNKRIPSIENIFKELGEIKPKTKDRFVKLLISHLEDNLNKTNKAS